MILERPYLLPSLMNRCYRLCFEYSARLLQMASESCYTKCMTQLKQTMAKKTARPRTYGQNRSRSSEHFSRRGYEKRHEPDGVFLFKLIGFIILSALWIRLGTPVEIGAFTIQAVPVGLFVALLIVMKTEKYQFNRKIWYATLILMAIFASFTPVGIVL